MKIHTIIMQQVVYFSLLLNIRFCFGWPTWYYPDSLINVQLDPNRLKFRTYESIVSRAFFDALELARVVVLTGSDCDPVGLKSKPPTAYLFKMHFADFDNLSISSRSFGISRKQDFDFVQALFAKIANIENPKNLGPDRILDLLQSFRESPTIPPTRDNVFCPCLLCFTSLHA